MPQIADMQTIADLGITNGTMTVIATRGERLALSRSRLSGQDQGPEAFNTEILGLVEINADERVVASVAFDPDESTRPSKSSTPGTSPAKRPPTRTRGRSSPDHSAVNRRQLPPMTPDFVSLTICRSNRIETGDLTASIRAMRDLTPDISQLHRSRTSAEPSRSGRHPDGSGTSQEGFDAEWRQIDRSLSKVTKSAGAKSSLRQTSTPRLRGSRNCTRRRGGWKTRQAECTNATRRTSRPTTGKPWRRCWPTTFPRTIAAEWWAQESDTVETRRSQTCGPSPTSAPTNMASTVIATRGERLALTRHVSRSAVRARGFDTEMLVIVEINADKRIAARRLFRP